MGECIINGCSRRPKTKGLCYKHYSEDVKKRQETFNLEQKSSEIERMKPVELDSDYKVYDENGVEKFKNTTILLKEEYFKELVSKEFKGNALI